LLASFVLARVVLYGQSCHHEIINQHQHKEDIMSTSTSQPAIVATRSINNVTDFSIVGDTLLIPNLMTSNLDAYRWNAPGNVPMYFIFADNDVHILTLEESEDVFSKVRTHNEEKDVTIVTEEETQRFSDEAERHLILQRIEQV
jgi:hypothetical protein